MQIQLTKGESNKQKGKLGEDIATNYLIQNGYEIICKNYQKRCGEIDIIARNNSAVVFVEVKYRKSVRFGYPKEAVTIAKQRKVIETAECFIYENSQIVEGYDIRLDVIEIIHSGNLLINHIEGAFCKQ